MNVDDHDVADAIDLAQRLQTTTSSQLRTLAREVELALNTPDSIWEQTGVPGVIHVAWGHGGLGASIYFPALAPADSTIEGYARGNAFAADTGWSAAIRAIW